MRRLQAVVVMVAALIGVGSISSSSADSIEELLSLGVELGGIVSQMGVSFDQYHALAKEIAESRGADGCRIVGNTTNKVLLANIQQQARRAVQILERAQALVQAGGTPPEVLARTLGNDTMSAMRGVVDASVALAAMLKQSEENCKKSG